MTNRFQRESTACRLRIRFIERELLRGTTFSGRDIALAVAGVGPRDKASNCVHRLPRIGDYREVRISKSDLEVRLVRTNA